MASRWLTRIAITTAAAGTFLITGATAAHANSTILINPGNLNTTAADFDPNNSCDPNQGGGPHAGQDVWVFVLPGGHATSGDFVSLTLGFDTGAPAGQDTTKTVPTDGGAFLNGGPATSKAYFLTPVGWILTSTSAEITGTADFFTLSHTCAGTPSTSPSPSPSPSPSRSPSASPSSSPGTSSSSSSSSPPDDGDLPVTGAALGGFVVTGLAMVTAGVALIIARRRRDLADAAPTQSE